jgi:hypothetical protein
MLEYVLEHLSPKTVLVALLASYALYKLAIWINDERKIRALGRHARRIPAYLPFSKFYTWPLLPTSPH